MDSTTAMPIDHLLPKPVRVSLKVPSSQAVRRQLSLILQSEGFIHADRMKRFLEFVVEKRLAGRCDELGEYGIGVAVFGRGESFCPAVDPIVRNDARRLRQKLLEYYQGRHGAQHQVIIEIPKGTYVPIFRFADHTGSGNSEPQYRLMIRLLRIADGVEIWNSQHEY
jgi:hypothetical protein